MKTIITLLTAFTLASGSAFAQYWTPNAAPHKHSSYYNGRGMDYSRHGGHHSIDPWFGRAGYFVNPCPVTFEASMVSKRYVTRFGPADRFHENLWGEQGRFLNGLQLGVGFQPTSCSGVGFRSGAFYEIYFASGPGVRDLGYNRFTEHDLYFPLHMTYTVPLAPYLVLNVESGLGFNVALGGIYRSWGRNGGIEWQHYGNYDAPDRINAMWEIGANVRYDHFKFGFNYGLGLNDNEFYDNARTRQNKFTLSAALVF